MFQQIFAIIRNTFLESVRQPIMLVVLVVATILIILANPLSAFTMANDQRMYIDMGLASVFLCGALLAAFIATNVLGREIENQTALTVISKPVSRPLFVLGKYFGVAGALALATAYMSFVFLLVDQHTVLQTVRDPIHVPVVIFGASAAVIGLGIGIWCNYFYNKVFSSTVICLTTPLAGLAYLFSLMFRPDFSFQPISRGFKPELWLALAGLMIAILILTAIAVAASTRLGQVMTLCVTVGLFILGMLSDWMFSRPIAKMDQDWTQRIKDMPETDLQALVKEDQLPAVRAWDLQVFSDQAHHRYGMWRAEYYQEVQKHRPELNRLTLNERESQLAVMEKMFRERFETQLGTDLDQARIIADSVQWPPRKSDLVHDLDWPLAIERKNRESEIIANQRSVAYPPLYSSVATTHERIVRGACQVASAIVPNFQTLWLSDAVTQEHNIPAGYMAKIALYGLCCIVASLNLAIALFQRREVG